MIVKSNRLEVIWYPRAQDVNTEKVSMKLQKRWIILLLNICKIAREKDNNRAMHFFIWKR